MWELQKSVTIDDVEYLINTDYRDILEIISILNNVNLADRHKAVAALEIFYQDELPNNIEQAIKEMYSFISVGQNSSDDIPSQKVMDWEQDYLSIVTDVNKVAGYEVRASEYLHWWTFVSYFNGVGEGRLSFLVSLREKLRKGKKLDEYEMEFYMHNKSKVDLKETFEIKEQAEIDRINSIFT